MTAENFGDRPFLTETPLDAIGPVIREEVIVEGKSFLLDHPDGSDRLLEHPTIRTAFAADEYLPYWADLWPAARMLAKAILREPATQKLTVLEIGCGLGLPGIAALGQGHHVIFSDYDATALHFAAANARLNGFDDFELLQLDWRHPPGNLKVPLLLAADLIYELRSVEPIVALIRKLLHDDGVCLLTDSDRVPSLALRESLPNHGLEFTTRNMHAGEPGGRRTKGTLYLIRQQQKTPFATD